MISTTDLVRLQPSENSWICDTVKIILPLRKRTTQHGYNVVLAHHILPEFGSKHLGEVTGEDVQDFATRQVGSGLAWNTVNNIGSVFSAIYAAAVKFGYLKMNPVRS